MISLHMHKSILTKYVNKSVNTVKNVVFTLKSLK